MTNRTLLLRLPRPRQLSHLAHWELFWRVFFVFNKFFADVFPARSQTIHCPCLYGFQLAFCLFGFPFSFCAGVRRSISIARHGQFTLKGLQLHLDQDKFHCLQRSNAPVMQPPTQQPISSSGPRPRSKAVKAPSSHKMNSDYVCSFSIIYCTMA